METTPHMTAGLFALGAAFMMMFFIVFSIILLITIIIHWRIYTKAGKPGWACIVPIYNAIIMMEIIGKPWWHIFLFLIPLYNIYLIIKYTNLFSRSFGQGTAFTIGLIFLGIIFQGVVAFSSSIKYVGPAGAAPAPIA